MYKGYQMKRLVLASTMLAGIAVGAAPAAAQGCDITVGVVMELTGPAGEYGKAGAKSVEMAFRDFNDAGGVGGCKLVMDTRDSQSQGNVAVDQATQLVNIKKVPVIIGGIISSVSIPILTSVTAPAGVVQVSPASSSPTLTALGREGKTNGVFFRTITSDALQGTAAAKYALDQGMKKIAIIHVNNDFGNNLMQEFTAAYTKLGGTITSTTPYNEKQASYSSEASVAMEGEPDALYLVSTPVDGATIARAWISGGGVQKFLFNDGMNSKDFIASVGPQYLNEAYGTSSGTTPTASTEYFNANYAEFSGGIEPSAPRPIDPTMPVPSSPSPSQRPARPTRTRSRRQSRKSQHPAARRSMPARPNSRRRSACSRTASRSSTKALSARSASTSTATSPAPSASGRSPTAR